MRKEHPILFSTPMVQAILEGNKNVTRRIVKDITITDPLTQIEADTPSCIDGDCGMVQFARWKPLEILWVREMFFKNGDEFIYRADGTCCEQFEQCECSEIGKPKWKPSIHMPKLASRIWLEISSIKIERLHNISDADILSEGIRVPVTEDGGVLFKLGEENSAWRFMPEQWQIDRHVENRGKEKYTETEHDFLFAHWAELWCKINGRESWDANPWVWVIEFKVVSTEGKPLAKKLSDIETV
jgi:hypothetical protein